MHTDTQKLIHHISRLEGQLASIKRELLKPNPDCEQAARTLKATARSFSSLRMGFVTCFLEYKHLTHKKSLDSEYRALMSIINS